MATDSHQPQDPHLFSRRHILKWGLAGTTGLLLADWLKLRALASPGVIVPKARSVIQIWMWGGPCHIDTFDPKPGAGRDYCGPLNKPIATNVDGIQIGQLLPLLAKQADKYAILRGMTHGNNAHETASYLVQTGRKPIEGISFPGLGAVVSLFKGTQGESRSLLPPYITLTTPQGRFSESGCLGSAYNPFSTGGDPNKEPFTVEGIVAEGITRERQIDRRTLLKNLDTFGKDLPPNKIIQALDASQEQAYAVILGDAGKVFDLSLEPEALRNKYGRNTFGQSCLLARRLVEQGVPFITINYRGWDTHKQHFETMNRKLPEMDRGFAALLEDLATRGLLDSTLVWWSGEFGRTPKVDWTPPWNGGRGHHSKSFSAVIAGGGMQGGTVVGETDERGETVTKRPIYPWDLFASIHDRLGIPEDAKLPHPQGKTLYASPFKGNEIPAKETGGVLKEIMKS